MRGDWLGETADILLPLNPGPMSPATALSSTVQKGQVGREVLYINARQGGQCVISNALMAQLSSAENEQQDTKAKGKESIAYF